MLQTVTSAFIFKAFTKFKYENVQFDFLLSKEHGNWSEWSQWTYCSESCGGGVNVRRRKCDNPAPYNGGDYCAGSGNDTKSCNQFRCSGKFKLAYRGS